MLSQDVLSRVGGLASLIGNTPLLAVDFLYRDEPQTLYAKAENLNMTGSIKDRMAFHILKNGYERGVLHPGDWIVEATSGNTGISFAAIGRALGHPVRIFMPDWMSEERKNLIRSLGARIRLVSWEEGGFVGSIRLAEEWASHNENAFLPRQFSNQDNIEAHFQTTGPEIWWQLSFRRLAIDAFVAGVGTGGTIMGVGRFLRKRNPEIKIYPVEPSNSPTLSTGCKMGKHRIQGISDEFIPPIFEAKEMSEVIGVDDGDAILMAQKLAADLGIGVGISSGANFLGALKVLNRLGPGATIVTVFPDDNKKYMSTDLLRAEPVKADFLTPEIELLRFRAFKRVCQTCCDPFDCIEAQAQDLFPDEPLPPCPRRKPSGTV
jgi:cysteine synthase A